MWFHTIIGFIALKFALQKEELPTNDSDN